MQVHFDSVKDTLWLTGDLVARGPDSLEVLRLVRRLGNSVRIVLGNHELHLLAVYAGIIKPQDNLKLTQLLEAPDADLLINWLRRQPVLQVDDTQQLVMVHAGITPQWNIETACKYAKEVEMVLSSDSDRYLQFLKFLYDSYDSNESMQHDYNESMQHSCDVSSLTRLRFNTNVFTRIRYCFPNGQLDLSCKDTPNKASSQLRPWFTKLVPPPNYSIVFGHWASTSIKGHGTPKGIYGLDTGCCWGGELTMLCWDDKTFIRQPCANCHNEQ